MERGKEHGWGGGGSRKYKKKKRFVYDYSCSWSRFTFMVGPGHCFRSIVTWKTKLIRVLKYCDIVRGYLFEQLPVWKD